MFFWGNGKGSPFLSAYLFAMFFCNALYGLFSLIFQRASIYQHEPFVYDYKPTIRDYCTKYMVNVNFMYVNASSGWLEGKAKTPAGKKAEVVRPRRSVSDEEAQRPPAESEVQHGNQPRCHKQFMLAPLSNIFIFRGGDTYVSISFLKHPLQPSIKSIKVSKTLLCCYHKPLASLKIPKSPNGISYF